VGITIKPLAYLNLLKMSSPAGAGPKTNETIALIDLGKIYSSLVIIREGRSILFREMTVGANEITNEISEVLNISWESAEKLKQGIGLTDESPAERLREELPRELLAELPRQGGIKEISNAMRPVLEKLVSEIERTIGWFHRQFPQESLKSLYITGGGGQLKKIETFLAEEVHLPVKRLEILGTDFMIKPSQREVSDNVEANRLALAIGLTERRSLHQINLLPPSARRFKEYLISYIKEKGLLYISLPFLVPVLILIAFGLNQWINYARQRKADLDNEINQYKSYSLPNFQALAKEVEQIQNEVAVLETTRRQEINWEAVFQELSRLTPAKKVWLTALNFETKPIQAPPAGQPAGATANPPAVKPGLLYLLELVGYAISQQEMGNFVEGLSRSPYFQKVDPPSIQKTQLTTPLDIGEVISFKISIQLSPNNNR
jgi:cell division ATPase FtsA